MITRGNRARLVGGSQGATQLLHRRLAVLVCRSRLDRELADGCPQDGSDARAVRARQLAEPVTRHELAILLRRAVADAEHPAAALGSVPVRRPAVQSSREGLLGLAERLERPGAVNPCGVARTKFLLTDRLGPLHSCLSGVSIEDAVWWVADGFQSCPPHRWGCPVIMKLDPEHVAWTCGRCGAIATTEDLAVRPASSRR